MVIETQEETEKRERVSFTPTILGLNATHNVTSFICTTRFLEFGRRNTTTAENILEYSHNWTSPTFVLRSKLTEYFLTQHTCKTLFQYPEKNKVCCTMLFK